MNLITIILNAQPITVTSGQSPAMLVNKILGQGILPSNITFSGNSQAKGIFTGGSLFASDSGIFLSTGFMNSTVADSASVLLNDDLSLSGNATLDSIINPTTTFDAAVLEFDFAVASDSFQLNLVFASEEYNEYVNAAFNDAFGVFLSGPGITGLQNITLVPGTSIPASINNINNGQSLTGAGTGPCMNCQFFNDNFGQGNFAFDGYTTPIHVVAQVQPCETYHLKIAIADAGDHLLNSSLFIEQGSFSSLGQISIFNNGLVCNAFDTIFRCAGDTVNLSLSNASNYNWSNGFTTQSINVVTSVTPTVYSAYVFNSSNFCYAYTPQIVVEGDSCLPKPSLIFFNDTLFSSVNDLNFNYAWRWNGAVIPNASNPYYKVLSGGCYIVTISDTLNHSISSDSLCLSFTGIMNNKTDASMFQPNPFSEYSQIAFDNFSGEIFSLILTDLTGKIISQKITRLNQFIISQIELVSGFYFYKIVNRNGTLIDKGKLVRL